MSTVTVSRQWVNPFEFFKVDPAAFPHVTFDPSLRRRTAQYYVIRSGSGDGTFAHTQNAMAECFELVLNSQTCHKSQNELRGAARYVIGPLRIASLCPVPMTLRSGMKYDGEMVHVGLPVVCTISE